VSKALIHHVFQPKLNLYYAILDALSREGRAMGAFGELFGFEGQINRLGYLWRTIIMAIVVGVLGGGAVWLLTSVLRPDGLVGVDVGAPQVLIGMVLLALWSSFALASRRLRDMGVEPAHIIPLYAALWVINTVLLEPMSRLDPAHYRLIEMAWASLQYLAAIPLLFWPGRGKPPPGHLYYETPQPTAYADWRGAADPAP
jgi:uncharacterized membrane protein YhaH (DUF805 family)